MMKISPLFPLALFAAISVSAEEAPDLPLLDISDQTGRHVVIAPGTEEVYQGHPYQLQMPDPNTLFVVWCINHGGAAGPMAKTVDGGLTWTRLDDRLPSEYLRTRTARASTAWSIPRERRDSGCGRRRREPARGPACRAS